ncbi:MAG: hypothetical protein MUO30_12960 [Anaerolineales bacterium]|nr:hypothetical protein [Anaerolineales bacterium]
MEAPGSSSMMKWPALGKRSMLAWGTPSFNGCHCIAWTMSSRWPNILSTGILT